ncbi:MAG: 30S ribosomal protein S7 [Candidatus Buchananbacteria bacterium RBG_13_36_9]|uniref:Small ribosomal subunit protein uS7 n=1 Tax=Candidatus Buchananbacteria bacterium RBG_13_36_9 TaxID=1797530 RepID=A0A1G1XMM2_9BACT|nr:MAG: 30S ribosomal protein S7 [Candidatus Buchananbacteria bacterium RBG_13_36_9]
MRGKQAQKRDIQVDPKFHNTQIAKFINYIMKGGKKSTAQNIVYDAFEIISDKTKQDALEIFEKALKNIGPSLEVRGRRIGGANYQIPYPVRAERRFALSCRWLIDASQKRKGRSMAEKLAQEIIDAANEQGEAFKKKVDTHRMAEANRAFAHFARF